MIRANCFEKEWIENLRKQKGTGGINPPLLEKMIHALYLLQNLKAQSLDFVFKGGTSLVLLLENAKRFSVDIDIIANKPYDDPATRSEIEDLLDRIVRDSKFQSWKLDEARRYREGLRSLQMTPLTISDSPV
jgi:predicted nucleotidyltransferase component of viral defense system